MAHNFGPTARTALKRILRVAVLATVAILLSVMVPIPAQAQFNPFGWLEQLFQPPGRVAKPKYEMHRTMPGPRQARPRPSRNATTAKVQQKPAVAPTYFVAVLGDSLAQM